jgi:hypothetical protein
VSVSLFQYMISFLGEVELETGVIPKGLHYHRLIEQCVICHDSFCIGINFHLLEIISVYSGFAWRRKQFAFEMKYVYIVLSNFMTVEEVFVNAADTQ